MIRLTRNHRFLIFFFLLLIAGWAFIATPFVNDHLVVPYTEWITAVSGAILEGMGEDVRVEGTLLLAPGFGVNIENGCNGIEAMLLVIAAIGAFPAGIMSRISGILVGGVLIQLLNFIRIVSLFLLGRYHENIFQLFHTAVWQILIVLAGVGIFLIWSARFATPRRVEAGS